MKGHTEKVDLNNENVEYVSLVGPNYAVEIIERAVTAILLASECEQTANKIKNLYNVSPDIKAEVFDKPEKLERVGIYKNIATFAFGIAINYITDKKKRTDLFIKILEDFTKYAQYVGLEDGNVEKNIEEMAYAFLGDMWMCMLHGISELSGKRSRNLTVSREVGEIVKEKQKLQKVLMNAWQKKCVKILNSQEDKENNLNDLFSCKMAINSPEIFVNLIAQKNGLRTIEGFQNYKRLLLERADLEIIQFITDALNGEDIKNHSYLNLAEREGRAEMNDEQFVQIKNETRKFKETTMELECPANTLAFVLCEYTKNVILKIENSDTKNHVSRMILDVFQEEKGLIKKIQDWVPTNIPLLGDYAKARQDKKQNVLDSSVDEAMITKA